jgi:hypothetical protein
LNDLNKSVKNRIESFDFEIRISSMAFKHTSLKYFTELEEKWKSYCKNSYIPFRIDSSYILEDDVALEVEG